MIRLRSERVLGCYAMSASGRAGACPEGCGFDAPSDLRHTYAMRMIIESRVGASSMASGSGRES